MAAEKSSSNGARLLLEAFRQAPAVVGILIVCWFFSGYLSTLSDRCHAVADRQSTAIENFGEKFSEAMEGFSTAMTGLTIELRVHGAERRGSSDGGG